MTHLSSASPHSPSQPATNGSSAQASDTSPSDAFSPLPGYSGGTSTDAAQPSKGQPGLEESWHYESAVANVETIINNIESGEMELAVIFDQFAIAVEHLHACETFLKHHRQQVDLLVETLTDESNF